MTYAYEENIYLTTSISTNWYLERLDEVIRGERKDIPDMPEHKEGAAFFSANILRAFFKQRLCWTPEDVLQKLDKNTVSANRLDILIDHLPCPAEIDRDQDLRFVAWRLYPNLRPDPRKLLTDCFMQVLSGKRESFPKDYFTEPDGRDRARILFQTMLTKMPRKFRDVDELYRFFANEEGLLCIKTWHLTEALKEVYQGDPLAFLHDSLPNDRSATLYWLYHQSMKRFARKTPPIEILKGPSDDITMPELVSSYQELNKEKCKNETIETILM